MTCTLPLKGDATDALPGTEQKILVMQARASRREAIFHRGDQLLNAGPGVIVFSTTRFGRRLRMNGVIAWDEKEYLRQHDHEEWWRENDRRNWDCDADFEGV